MSVKLILDVDTGTDDAVALMVAALCPEIDLIAATTVNGNCPVDICTENTLRVFDYIGVDIPVYEGCAEPLVRPNIQRHGKWTQHLPLPEATSKKQPQHAVDWLIETYMASDGDIVLAPVGPLTNVAMAIRQEPRILERIPEIVIMGGGHEVGNSTPSAEFNIWVDPEAARIVLNCGRPIRLFPLDATHRAVVCEEAVQRMRNLGTPAALAAADCIEPRIRMYDATQPIGRPGCAPVHDALVVCALLEPDIVQTHYLHVDVETTGELTDGRTVIDTHKRSGAPPNAHVAFDADEPLFNSMLMEYLGRTTA